MRAAACTPFLYTFIFYQLHQFQIWPSSVLTDSSCDRHHNGGGRRGQQIRIKSAPVVSRSNALLQLFPRHPVAIRTRVPHPGRPTSRLPISLLLSVISDRPAKEVRRTRTIQHLIDPRDLLSILREREKERVLVTLRPNRRLSAALDVCCSPMAIRIVKQ